MRFDAACEEVGDTGQPPLVREVMAKSIIDAARAGERDVNRLRDAALSGLKSLGEAEPENCHRAGNTSSLPRDKTSDLSTSWSELGGDDPSFGERGSRPLQLFLYPTDDRFGNRVQAKIDRTPIPRGGTEYFNLAADAPPEVER